MITKLLTKVIGSRNDRTLRCLRKIVKEINNYEPTFEALSDEELKAELEKRSKNRKIKRQIQTGVRILNLES